MVCSRASGDCQLYKKSPQAFSFSYKRINRLTPQSTRISRVPYTIFDRLGGTLTEPLVKSVYHKKSVYGSQFMITFALTWGSLRLTLNCLMMLLP